MIAVCGEALFDEVHAPDGAVTMRPGGGPFNTARSLGRLGTPAAFAGCLSDDDLGRGLAALLAADGVSLELACTVSQPTTVAVATVASDGAASYEFRIDGSSAPRLSGLTLGEDVDAIHVGSLGLVVEPVASTLLELLRREHGKRLIMLDPNVRTGLLADSAYRERMRTVIRQSDVVKASDTDLAWIYPGIGYVEAAEALLDAGVRLAVVTLGAEGAFGAHAEARIHVAATPVDVVDTIGAGDAFGAGLLAWLCDHGALHRDLELDRGELRGALDYSCRVAALTCTTAGAEPPTRAQVAAFGVG